MALYSEQFSEEYDFPYVSRPKKVLVIASTARSGSHMLGHALYQTGAFGFPLEYANPSNLKEWKQRLSMDSLDGVLQELQQRRTSPNGVFGIKLHYSHIKQFGDFAKVKEYFPDANYLLLTRKGLLKQAVSLAIARQSGKWISGQEGRDAEPKFDYEQIDRCLRQTILDNASWRYTLESSASRYMELEYEDVLEDFSGTIRRIAEFMNVELCDADIPSMPVTKKQSGVLSDEWCDRYLSHHDERELLYGYKRSLMQKVLRR